LRTYSEPHSMIPCSECNIGQMHKTSITYFTWLNGEMITVPDFPAWVCDICGKREYDHDAVDQLARLLSTTGEINRVRPRTNHLGDQVSDKRHTSPIE